VRRLVIRPNGWSVTASVRNDTRVGLLIERPHHPGGAEFGVLSLDNADTDAVERAGSGVFATRFEPPLPRVLRPHATWSGTFSGPGRLSRAGYLRVELGRFTRYGPSRGAVPRRFRYVTDHVVRLR
jgi:hypothetical protein